MLRFAVRVRQPAVPGDKMAHVQNMRSGRRFRASTEGKHATLLHKEEQIANFGRVRLSTLSNSSFVGRTRHLLFQALAQLRQRLLQRRRRDNVARAISRTEEPDVAVVRESPNGLQPTLSVARDDADAIMTEATTDLEGSVTNLKPRHTCAVINLLWRSSTMRALWPVQLDDHLRMRHGKSDTR